MPAITSTNRLKKKKITPIITKKQKSEASKSRQRKWEAQQVTVHGDKQKRKGRGQEK